MGITVVDTSSTPADRKFGYRFGVDGLMAQEEAIEFLGNPSLSTIDRRVEEGKLRRGKDKGRVVLCRRSVVEYVASCEG